MGCCLIVGTKDGCAISLKKVEPKTDRLASEPEHRSRDAV